MLWVSPRKLLALGFTFRHHFNTSAAELVRSATVSFPRLNPAHGKVVVTGAARGIGKELTLQLWARGAEVIAIDRDWEKGTEDLRSLQIDSITCDLSGLSEIESLVEILAKNYSNLAWWINCAGLGYRGDFIGSDPQRLKSLLVTNVLAPTILSHAFLRSTSRERGRVLINLASSAAFQPLPFFSAYSASKSFVHSLSLGIMGEQTTSDSVAVISVCPSGVDTSFQQAAGVKKVPGESLLTAERVAGEIIRSASRRRSRVLTIGAPAHGMSIASRFLPSQLSLKLFGALAKKLR